MSTTSRANCWAYQTARKEDRVKAKRRSRWRQAIVGSAGITPIRSLKLFHFVERIL